MLGLRLDDASVAGPLTILALGAHADDVEIGCGGTLLRLAQSYPDATVHWVVLSADGMRADEARLSATAFLEGYASSRIIVKSFRDGFFPYTGGDVKVFFEELKGDVAPDVIFTHQRLDLHQDHRIVSELTWNTFRNHLILEYEIPKYDGDLGAPNVFIPLSAEIAEQKIDSILTHFATQLGKHWLTEDLLLALLRLRGMESNSPSKRAEAFYCRKLVL
jgi:LmbE family N-acetylglucosaminyl deacetylase